MQQTNIDFLRPFVVPGVLERTSDLGKKIEDILGKMQDNSPSLKVNELRHAIEDKDSQIGDKETFYNHSMNTGEILQEMVYMLQSKSKELDDTPPPPVSSSPHENLPVSALQANVCVSPSQSVRLAP